LQHHASPTHIHLTTRRCFIGPIPEGWLKSHRKSWYKHYFRLEDYSSRAATFSANPSISHQRQITGLDGPSASVAFGPSFPQPADIENDGNGSAGTDLGQEVTDGANDDNGGMSVLEAQSTAQGAEGDVRPGNSPRKQFAFRKKPLHRAKTSSETEDSSARKRTPSFVTAPMKPRKTFTSRLAPVNMSTSPPQKSFVTAKENPSKIRDEAPTESPLLEPYTPLSPDPLKPSSDDLPRPSNGTNSTTNLISHQRQSVGDAPSPEMRTQDSVGENPKNATPGLVRFNVNDEPKQNDNRTATKMSQVNRRKSWRRLHRGQADPGEIVKMEKMLVRIDMTMHELAPDFDENDSLKIESRAIEKWREFVVVCRKSSDGEGGYEIQMYKTRVIPSRERAHVSSPSAHKIPLSPKTTHVNLYSSLDKTLVLWVPSKKTGTTMYILRTRSASSAVEWYTFIRQSLGWQRSHNLQVNVPDLSVSLQLENPFGELEASISAAQAEKASDDAVVKTMEAEKAVASQIIQKSLKMLENNPEWADVLNAWLSKEKIGLAWKRYDRLEWVHGANEQKMYGTLAMQQTHELELRPKDHYPTDLKVKKDTLVEPAPVEGFLIRLTSQKGNVRRLGKMYFKRLYFTTHNQYLCYCRPARALPPPPPKLPTDGGPKMPSASEIAANTPLIFAANPYPTHDGQIDWLRHGTRLTREKHDSDAYKEVERKINTMLQAEGYINLSHVSRVQDAQRGNSVADANVDEGPDVDFHEEVDDTPRDDGKTNQFDDKRTFELVMKNKLVVRLQAFNEETKKEWITRLRKLVHYWKLRLADDMTLFKTVRGMNLKRLEIDEEMEAYLGQFARKWEVTRSVASPELFNMCGISCCRAITVSACTSVVEPLLT